MANVIYNSYKADALKWNIDLENDTIKVALVTSSYTPDIDSHDFFNDITWESSWTWYDAWWATIAWLTVTIDTANDKAVLDWTDVTWTDVSLSAAWAVIYKSTWDAATSPLIAYLDFGWTKTSSEWDFKIVWNASWIITLS